MVYSSFIQSNSDTFNDDSLPISVSAANGRPEGSNKIKCYQCNSFYDTGCADFFDNKTYPLKPCAGNATMCRKIIQESKYS